MRSVGLLQWLECNLSDEPRRLACAMTADSGFTTFGLIAKKISLAVSNRAIRNGYAVPTQFTYSYRRQSEEDLAAG